MVYGVGFKDGEVSTMILSVLLDQYALLEKIVVWKVKRSWLKFLKGFL